VYKVQVPNTLAAKPEALPGFGEDLGGVIPRLADQARHD
jgi:hypothetical protein